MMKLFKQYLEESLRDFRDDDIKVRFIGDTEAFSSDLRQLIEETREVCKDRTGMVLNIAMNYGGRDEILRAVKQISQKGISGESLRRRRSPRRFSPGIYIPLASLTPI